MNRIYEPIGAIRQRAVIDPDIPPAEDGHAVAVRRIPPPRVPGGVPDHGVPRLHAVVDVDPVEDHVRRVVDGDARAAGDVDAGAAAVDGLVRAHHQLLLEADDHVGSEDYPERLVLDDGVAERAGFWVDGVVVGGVGDDVDTAVLAAEGVLAEADGAVGEAVAMGRPVGVAAPAVVDWVGGGAGVVLT